MTKSPERPQTFTYDENFMEDNIINASYKAGRAHSVASSVGHLSAGDEMTSEDIFDGPEIGESNIGLDFGKRGSRAFSNSSLSKHFDCEDEFTSSNVKKVYVDGIEIPKNDFETSKENKFPKSAAATTNDLLKTNGETTSKGTSWDYFKRDEEYSRRISQRTNLNEEDLFIIVTGYSNDPFSMLLYYVFSVLTLGGVLLVFYWLPKHYIKFVGRKTPLDVCDWVSIEDQWGNVTKEMVIKKKFNNYLSTLFPFDKLKSDFQPDTKDPFLENIRIIDYRYSRLIYHKTEDKLYLNHQWNDSQWIGKIYQAKEGLTQDTYNNRKIIFGPNLIDIQEKSMGRIMVDEALHPFYVFQLFSCILWYTDTYYYYASCILSVSVLSILYTTYNTSKTLKKLREISRFNCQVRILRAGYWTFVNSSDLVPGDIIELSDPSLETLPCDALLLSGDAIINESMLTGETIPVTKTPAETKDMQRLFNASTRILQILSKHYLFGGTKLVQVKRPVSTVNKELAALALVTRTGFDTSKGGLIRSIMYPKPIGFKFYQDSFRFIGVMSIVGVGGCLFCVLLYSLNHADPSLVVRRALDVITVTVPPALPATLSIGISFAVRRLKKKQVSCISPQRINYGGKVDTMVFDKTGTLTEDCLDVLGVVPVNDKENKFDDTIASTSEFIDVLASSKDLTKQFLCFCMANCHQLRLVGEKLVGDPLDEKIFEFTAWNLRESVGKSEVTSGTPWMKTNIGPRRFVIIRKHDFNSSIRRISVISIMSQTKKSFVFMKGAPEIIPVTCKPETIPPNFQEQISKYTHKGYRVIACAYKELEDDVDLDSYERSDAESKLNFLGLVIFENKLKAQSKYAIEELKHAEIKTIMCSGDNILTAICVAQQCKIIDEDTQVFVPRFSEDIENEGYIRWEAINNPDLYLDANTLQVATPVKSLENKKISTFGSLESKYCLAITGDIFKWLDEFASQATMETALRQGLVYARMSPDEKSILVDRLRSMGHIVGFCGDGANDCGALKAADIGISLSEAESSVAAPFTSSRFDVSCVIDVIKEGRAALTNSFSCFQFMTLYSGIQFISVCVLYTNWSNLGDYQYLWIDLFLVLPLAIFMGKSKPFNRIVINRPASSLVSHKIIGPILLQLLIIATLQISVFYVSTKTSWAIRPKFDSDFSSVTSSDNTVIFSYSLLQYLIYVVCLTIGPPYRQPFYKNWLFFSTLLAETTICFIIIFTNIGFIKKVFGLIYIPTSFRILMLAFAIANFAIAWIGQQYLFVPLSRFIAMAFKRFWYGRSKSYQMKMSQLNYACRV